MSGSTNSQYGGGARTTPAYPGVGAYGNSTPAYNANYAMQRMNLMPSYQSGGYGQYGRSNSGYGFPPINGRFTTQPPPGIPQAPQTPTQMPSLDPNLGTGDYMNKPAVEGGPAPYTGGAIPAPNMTGRIDSMQIPQAPNPLQSNFANVAGFRMPGAQQSYVSPTPSPTAPNFGVTPQQWQTQNAQLLRPQTVQDPATMAGPVRPPMPPQPADNQYGQHGSYWGPAPTGSAYSGQPFGWHPQFNAGVNQYMIGQMNGPNGPPSWLNQIDPNDYLGSIGRLSGTPYNPAIFGAP